MNVNTNLDNLVVLSLSRKNLEGLIHQLDEDKKGDPAQIMRRIDETLFIVVAEENDVHYNSTSREAKVRGESGSAHKSQTYGEAHAA